MKQIIANLLSVAAVVLAGVGFLFATAGERTETLTCLGAAFVMVGTAWLLNSLKAQNRSLKG